MKITTVSFSLTLQLQFLDSVIAEETLELLAELDSSDDINDCIKHLKKVVYQSAFVNKEGKSESPYRYL